MEIRFLPPEPETEVFGIAEATICTGEPIEDPFRCVTVQGECDGRAVRGFCDAQDGSVYRIRFMPMREGEHAFSVVFRYGETEASHTGRFTARDAGRPGLLQADPDYPFHFRWSASGEHFFWNATTAYMMAGCSEPVIEESLARLASLGINRVRVSLCPSRQRDGGRWYEPQVKPGPDFHYLYGPWLQARPDSQSDPGWDVTRFDVAYWQKYERLLRCARWHDILVQVIFFTDAQEPYNYPFDRERVGDDPDERRYYAYAAARLAAFDNVEWCLTNEWTLFRPDEWAEAVGPWLSECDPYGHLTSIHGHGHFPFRTSGWADFALFQSWDEHGGYAFMQKNRQEQIAAGRPMPQINEEYGYEDSYPQVWGGGRVAPARNADSRRRLAWEITMAGGYQTTGESAVNGLGGWINGRGDASMTMLEGYRRLKEFFTAFAWWRLEPRPDLAEGAMCLAEPGARYVLYLPDGSQTPPSVILEGGSDSYEMRWYNPRAGRFVPEPDPDGDMVLLIERR